MQKLTIKNFGTIPNCELEIKDFMIFIGEQATGKSTICKCVYFFRKIKDELLTRLFSIVNDGLSSSTITDFTDFINHPIPLYLILNLTLTNMYSKLFGLPWPIDKMELKYEFTNDIWIKVTPTNDKYVLNITYSPILFSKIEELESYSKDMLKKISESKDSVNDSYLELEKIKIYKYIEKKLNDLFQDYQETFYIPAGRGLLTLMTNQLTRLDYESIDYVNKNFMDLIQSSQNKFESGILGAFRIFVQSSYGPKNSEKIEKLAEKIEELLKGDYRYINGKEVLFIDNSEIAISLNYASSGQQEMLWILNLLYIWMLEQNKNPVQNKSVFVIIEEPEAHLFPKAQKELVEYISEFINITGSKVFLTTHSPYILTSANNLLYAGKIGAIDEKRNNEVNEIIEKDKWINPDTFDACMVGGKPDHVRSIIDEDLKEIVSEEIDEISDIIRREYAKIYTHEVEDEFTED